MKKEIPVFFAIDDGYVPFAGCAIKSLIKNSSKEYKYKIVILSEGLKQENKDKLKALEEKGYDIEFVDIEQGLESITNREENKLRCDFFTLTIYFRIFIPDMFPQYDKGIYIDSDVILAGDISKLYNIDLEGNLIGACLDHSIEDIDELTTYTKEAVGSNKSEYINSGVLLMDLKKLREVKFAQKFLDLLNTYHFRTVAPDQDYINAMCYGKIKFLDQVWDAMPNDAKPEVENPELIHFNLFFKPWCHDNIQYERYFWDIAKQTNFYDEIVEYKANYSDEQKKADEQTLGKLIATAVDITNNEEKTFRKMQEKENNIRI